MSALAQKQLIESDPKARFRNAPRKPDFTIGQDWGRYTPAEHDRGHEPGHAQLFQKETSDPRLLKIRQYLARIHDVVRVDGALDGAHHVERGPVEFQGHIAAI
jgi:hypothetical protein